MQLFMGIVSIIIGGYYSFCPSETFKRKLRDRDLRCKYKYNDPYSEEYYIVK